MVIRWSNAHCLFSHPPSTSINVSRYQCVRVCVCGRTACILSRSSCLRSVSKYLCRWNRKANALNMLALGTVQSTSSGRRTTEPAKTCSFSLFEKLFNGAHSNVFYDHIIYPKICSCISKLERQQATAKRNLAQTHTHHHLMFVSGLYTVQGERTIFWWILCEIDRYTLIFIKTFHSIAYFELKFTHLDIACTHVYRKERFTRNKV